MDEAMKRIAALEKQVHDLDLIIVHLKTRSDAALRRYMREQGLSSVKSTSEVRDIAHKIEQNNERRAAMALARKTAMETGKTVSVEPTQASA